MRGNCRAEVGGLGIGRACVMSRAEVESWDDAMRQIAGRRFFSEFRVRGVQRRVLAVKRTGSERLHSALS